MGETSGLSDFSPTEHHPRRRKARPVRRLQTRPAAAFLEMKGRIERAIDYIKSFKPEQIDGSEARAIVLKTRSGDLNFEGQAYLLHYVIPNLFFHCTTAYDILRASGANIGKNDFIGKP